MPTILRIGLFGFFSTVMKKVNQHIFMSKEIVRWQSFGSNPVSLASSTRFSAKELRKLEMLVTENENTLMEAWNEYFSS